MAMLDWTKRMPELPEVETLRRGLQILTAGRTITHARILVPKMVKGRVSDPQELVRLLQGTQIKTIGRRGKNLLFTLDSGYHLLLHLKMRGQLLVVPSETAEAKYLAAALRLDNGQELRFHDMWTWGEMRLLSAQELASYPPLLLMGAEPLEPGWMPQDLADALARRPKAMIKAALLNQATLAGVGNIYADESLFRSRLQPTRPAGSLTREEVGALHQAIRGVLSEATGGGGTTSDNYVDAEGAVGRYVPLVYDRGGEPCTACAAPLTRTKVIGRGTVFCSRCQK